MQSKIRFEIFKRDKFTCQYCGAKSPDVTLQVDHRLALAKGGKDVLENLVTSCLNCNHGKASTDINENQIDKYKETKKGYQIEYKQFKVPPDLHKKIKAKAVKRNKTVVQLLYEIFNQLN